MCELLQSIGNSVTNILNTGVSFAGQAASKVYEFSGHVISYITPKLADLADKVNSINVPTYLSGAFNFAKSPVGISTLALGSAILLLVASRKIENKLAKGLLLVAGVASLVFSAVAVTRPFGFMKA